MSNLNEHLQDFKFQYIEIYGNCNQVKDPIRLSSDCIKIQINLSKTIKGYDEIDESVIPVIKKINLEISFLLKGSYKIEYNRLGFIKCYNPDKLNSIQICDQKINGTIVSSSNNIPFKTINSSDDQPFFHMCFNELGEYKIYSNGICDELVLKFFADNN